MEFVSTAPKLAGGTYMRKRPGRGAMLSFGFKFSSWATILVVEPSFLDPAFSSQRQSREGVESSAPLTSLTSSTTGLRSDKSRASIVEICGVELSRGFEDAVGMLSV